MPAARAWSSARRIGLGRHRRAPARIQAQDHGIQLRVAGDILERASKLVGRDLGAERTIATPDQAGGADQRHPCRRAFRLRRHGGVLCERDRGRLGTGPPKRKLERLVVVEQDVDQFRRQRVVGAERAAVDQLLNDLRRQLARVGDPGHELPVERVEERIELLAVGARKLAVGQALEGRLVLGAPQHLHADAQAREQFTRQRHLDADPGQADQPTRLQFDRVERRGDVVALVARGELAEGVCFRHRELAGGPEAAHGVAQLLRHGETVLGLGQPHENPGDPWDPSRPRRGPSPRR